MYTTRSEIRGVQARAAGAFVEHHELFALFKAPERRRQRPNIHRLRGDVQKVVQNAANLGIEHANQRPTARHFHTCQLFNCQTPGMFLVHRRHVIQPVEIRQVLQIRPAFHQLFGAAMQQTDMRITALYYFAVKFQHQSQNTMRRRVLRAEVDVEVADRLFAGNRINAAIVKFGAVHHDRPPSTSSLNAMIQRKTSAISGKIVKSAAQFGNP